MRMTWFMTRCVKGMHGKEKGLLMLSLLAFCGSYPSTFLRRTVTMVSRHWHLRKRTEEMERKTFKSHERDWEEIPHDEEAIEVEVVDTFSVCI